MSLLRTVFLKMDDFQEKTHENLDGGFPVFLPIQESIVERTHLRIMSNTPPFFPNVAEWTH